MIKKQSINKCYTDRKLREPVEALLWLEGESHNSKSLVTASFLSLDFGVTRKLTSREHTQLKENRGDNNSEV